jgi:hypothetical protein
MSAQPDTMRKGGSIQVAVSDRLGRERAIWLLGQDAIRCGCDHIEMHLTDKGIWWNELPVGSAG